MTGLAGKWRKESCATAIFLPPGPPAGPGRALANGYVSNSAFSALKSQSLSASDWAAIARLVDGGRIGSSADATLVELVGKNRAPAGADGEAILRKLMERNQGDNDVGAIIQSLLASR